MRYRHFAGTTMRTYLTCGAFAVLALFAGAAHALTCHIVLDRKDNIVYRDVSPPFDMSDRGAAAPGGRRRSE